MYKRIMWLTQGKKDPIGQHSKGSNNQMEKQKKLRKKISIGTTSKGNWIQSDNRAGPKNQNPIV